MAATHDPMILEDLTQKESETSIPFLMDSKSGIAIAAIGTKNLPGLRYTSL
jgi:hypothetical protein